MARLHRHRLQPDRGPRPGELGTVGSAAAVGNAVVNATGIRVRGLPIPLDKLIG